MTKAWNLLCGGVLLLGLSAPVWAQTIEQCHRRAEAGHHSRLARARQELLSRQASCRTLPSPDRAEQCMQAARRTYESRAQASRERLALERRACRQPT